MTHSTVSARLYDLPPDEPHPRPRRWSSIENAARYVRVGPPLIRKLITTGELTAYRISERVVRVDLTELDALMRPGR